MDVELSRTDRRQQANTLLLHMRGRAVLALQNLRAIYRSELDAIEEDGSEAPDLIAFYGSIRKTLEVLELEMSRLTGISNHLKYGALPETFSRDNIKTLTDGYGDRVTIVTDTLASILTDNRDQAYKWLRDHQHGDLIVDYIFPSSLSAFARTWMEDHGKDFPADSMIKVEMRTRATLTPGKDSPNRSEKRSR